MFHPSPNIPLQLQFISLKPKSRNRRLRNTINSPQENHRQRQHDSICETLSFILNFGFFKFIHSSSLASSGSFAFRSFHLQFKFCRIFTSCINYKLAQFYQTPCVLIAKIFNQSEVKLIKKK